MGRWSENLNVRSRAGRRLEHARHNLPWRDKRARQARWLASGLDGSWFSAGRARAFQLVNSPY
jgi:hypothetical protein